MFKKVQTDRIAEVATTLSRSVVGRGKTASV